MISAAPDPKQQAQESPRVATREQLLTYNLSDRSWWRVIMGSRPSTVVDAKADVAACSAQQHPPSRFEALYRDAFDASISFLTLGELQRLVCCSSRMKAAVARSASIIHAVLPRAQGQRVGLAQLCASPLARHMVEIDLGAQELHDMLLHRVAKSMPHLQLLVCALSFPPRTTLQAHMFVWPSRLRSLTLLVPGEPPACCLNLALQSIARLPSLSELRLALPCGMHGLSLLPLMAATSLESFSLSCTCSACSHLREPDHALVDGLRSLGFVRTLAVTGLSEGLLTRLLKLPRARPIVWENLGVLIDVTARTCEALPSLPTLSTLHARLGQPDLDEPRERMAFLGQLPRLSKLHLLLECSRVMHEAALHHLQSCAQLTELTLSNSRHATAALLKTALAGVPLLNHLRLFGCTGFRMLDFLAQPSFPRMLTCLALLDCSPLAEEQLKFVLPLKALEQLELIRSVRMGVHCRLLYTPPSVLLPALRHFFFEPPAGLHG